MLMIILLYAKATYTNKENGRKMEGYREIREIYTNDTKKIFIKHFLTAPT